MSHTKTKTEKIQEILRDPTPRSQNGFLMKSPQLVPFMETISQGDVPITRRIIRQLPEPAQKVSEFLGEYLVRPLSEGLFGGERAQYDPFAILGLRPETKEEAIRSGLIPVMQDDQGRPISVDPFGVAGTAKRGAIKLGDKLLRKLVKSKDPKSIVPDLVRIGVARKTAKEIAPQVAKSKDPTQISEFVRGALSRERGFVTSAKEVVPTDKIAGQYIPRGTDALAMRARTLIKDNPALAERIVLEESDDRAVATASEFLKKIADDVVHETDPVKINALYDKAAEVANTTARKLTDLGRAVQAAAILGRLTPEGQIRFAAKEIQRWNRENPRSLVKELTKEQAKEIGEEMRFIQTMPEGEAKAMRFKALQDKIHDLIPSKWWQKAVSVWKAGLLTGIKTSGLNIFSNTSHAAILETAKDVPAAGADILLSLITGKRTLVATTRGIPSGIREGAERGWRYLKTGHDVRDVGKKLDYKRTNFKHKAIQKYVDTVFRVLGAQDQVFYYGSLKRSLYNQAKAQAKNKGLRGIEAEKFVDDLVENSTNEMSMYALADAETAVFQNKTTLGGIARKIQEIPGGEFVVPFGRTPSAVAMQTIYYSPAGVFIEIGKQIARGKFDQRLLSQAIGRSTIGTGVLWTGTQLYENDLMTLDSPKTERERELWKVEGRKANSIKVGDKWRTVQSFGPAGPVMLIGGHFRRAIDEGGSHTEAMISAVFGTIKSFTEQTFLKGVNDVMNAIADPQLHTVRSVASSFISSFIPTIINDMARATDPKERRTQSESLVKEVENRMIARIPGFRQILEPQVDILGRDRARVGNPLEVMIDPTRPSPDVSTPVVQELRRLHDADFKVSPTLLGNRAGYKGLTPKQNTELWRNTGTILNKKLEGLFRSQQYQGLEDGEKAKTVEDFVEKTKINALAAMVIEVTDGLSGEELRKKLSELKASKLLTRDVFTKYQQLR